MIRNIISSHSKEIIEEVKPYLEFKSLTPMTITPNYTNTGITLQYSLDTVNWVNIAAKAVTPSSNIIYFRGSAVGTKSLFTGGNVSNAWLFTGATNLEVNGDITMLIQNVLGGAVSEIPLANFCYNNMFYNCTSLVKAPTLPSTTLANNCYSSMFQNCRSLTTTPELPSTTLAYACYNGMFYNCSSLTTAPALPAITLANFCYNGMFQGCTSLTTVQALPATTLADYCYNNMFSGCRSLVTAPTLPAIMLANFCYSSMFYNCGKIKISTTNVGSYNNTYRVPFAGTGIVGTNSLADMFTGTGGTFKGTPTINTTYYTENTVV